MTAFKLTMKKIFDNFILLVCLGLSGYFTTTQFIRYSMNEDLSLVSYRKLKFDSESKDQYPIYTICLNSRPWGQTLFKRESYVWAPNMITDITYQKFLLGSFSYKFFKRLPAISNTTYEDVMQTFSEIKFEDVVIDLMQDILTKFASYDRKGRAINLKKCLFNIFTMVVLFCLVQSINL